MSDQHRTEPDQPLTDQPLPDQPLPDQPLTDEEASAFSDKLDAFSETLTEREQAILNHLLAAAGHQDEVAGFAKSALDSFLDIQGSSLRTRDLSQTALAPMTGSTLFIKMEIT